MNEVVLDASAVLAFVNRETGARVVEPYLSQAVMSAVNWSEVVAKLAERGIPEAKIQKLIDRLNIKVISVDQQQATVAGMLRLKTKEFGLSLGDRMCLALGLHLNRPVLTTDQQWDRLDIEGVEVILAR